MSLYRQTAKGLAADIAAQALEPGTRLESERVLCARLGVSRVTLRSALALLALEGTVVSSAARGWFVAPAVAGGGPAAGPSAGPSSPYSPLGSPPLVGLSGFSELAAAQSLDVTSRVLLVGTRPATLDESETFGTVPGSGLFVLHRVRYLNGLVIAVDHSRIPAVLVPGADTVDFTRTSLYQWLRSEGVDVIPTSADYRVEATPASPEESALLELSPPIPLLVASQRTYDQHEQLFELGRTAYRGDRYRFRATLGAPRRSASETTSVRTARSG